ncbi:MAG: hypothetical protein FWD99_03805 [Oscillospiraceae bacterium]|nr:hypothetical protein [Oscillospiraceae bacterium]
MKRMFLLFLICILFIAFAGCNASSYDLMGYTASDCDCLLCRNPNFSSYENGIIHLPDAPVVADDIFDAFSASLDRLSMTPGMDEYDFKNTLRAIIFENGMSIYQMGPLYVQTGFHSIAYAFGDWNNTARYSTEHNDCCAEMFFSVHISSDVSGVIFPENIRRSDSFRSVLEAFGLIEGYNPVEAESGKQHAWESDVYAPDFSISNNDNTKSIGIRFHTWHGMVENADLESARATVYFTETVETPDENGRAHIYTRRFSLIFGNGTLGSFNFSLNKVCVSPGEPEIDNEKIGIRLPNPQFEEHSDRYDNVYHIRFERIYHDGNQNIYITYTIRSETEIEFIADYTIGFSVNRFDSPEPFTHTVVGERRITDIIHFSDYWTKDLNESIIDFFWTPFPRSILFIDGSVLFNRPF